MAKKKINELIEKFAREKVLNENLEEIFSERFSRYSKYIIQDRALPPIRRLRKPSSNAFPTSLPMYNMHGTEERATSACPTCSASFRTAIWKKQTTSSLSVGHRN